MQRQREMRSRFIMPLTIYLAYAASLIGFDALAYSGDVLFLPGDAFFHTHVDFESQRNKWSVPQCELHYELPSIGQKAFGDTVGVSTLKIVAVDNELLVSLRETVQRIRAVSPSIPDMHAEETNPIHLFVYSLKYDPSQWTPFIKYNREWVQVSRLISPTAKVRAGRFVPDLSGDEDRFADQVPRFKCDSVSKQIVAAKASDTRWLVLSDEQLRAHVRFVMGEIPQDPLVLYDLISGTTRRWERISGRLRSKLD